MGFAHLSFVWYRALTDSISMEEATMRIPLIVLTTAALAAGCDVANEAKPNTKPMVDYPETHQIAVVDEYCDTSIKDPYRWLEDDHSNVTKA